MLNFIRGELATHVITLLPDTILTILVCFTDMDLIASTLQSMVDSFTIEEELMNFAATWGVQESPIVKLRLFQLRNQLYDDDFVNEELNSLLFNLGGPSDQTSSSEYVQDQVEVELPSVIYDDLNLASEYVQEQVEMEECIKALLFDDEIEDLLSVEDGDFEPPTTVVQSGSGQQKLRYTMRKKSERTYAKNAAVDRTYQITANNYKISERGSMTCFKMS